LLIFCKDRAGSTEGLFEGLGLLKALLSSGKGDSPSIEAVNKLLGEQAIEYLKKTDFDNDSYAEDDREQLTAGWKDIVSGTPDANTAVKPASQE
jgi:hypothetical protein